VSARLSLVSHAPTSATSATAFPADEPLDTRGRSWAEDGCGQLPGVTRMLRSPAPACDQTATALQLVGDTEPQLRDWDLGRWRGRTFDDVAASEPAAVQAWLSQPDSAPHGGERLTELLSRIGDWLDHAPADGHTVVITHPAVVRAAVIATLSAPAPGFWRIDIAPLTVTVLRGRPGRWTLRTTGLPLRTAGPAVD
jgi:broad specificity phosphatase PhoE